MTNVITTQSSKITTTDIINESVDKFNEYAKKTAEGIIKMSRIVYDTKYNEHVNRNDFEKFCSKIGYKSTSSSIKKLVVIGKFYNELMANIENLPNNWTTLYEIARLSKDQLDAFIEEGLICKTTKGDEIKRKIQLIAEGHNDRVEPDLNEERNEPDFNEERSEIVPNGTNSSDLYVSFKVKNFDESAHVKELKKIIITLEKIGIEVDMSPQLESLLNSLNFNERG